MGKAARLRRGSAGADRTPSRGAIRDSTAPSGPAAPARWTGPAGPALSLGVQTKPVIGEPGDAFEQEADAVATRVTAGLPAPAAALSHLGPGGLGGAQRMVVGEGEEEETTVQRMEADEEPIQTQTAEEEEPLQLQTEEEEPLQMSPEGGGCSCGSAGSCTCGVQRSRDAGGGGSAGTALATTPSGKGSMSEAAAAAIRQPGAGSAIPPGTRSRLEGSMGADLSGVRVHTGPRAHDASSRLRARAFTHGHHIWLGRGESPNDVPLMAHEVTHVFQQGGAVRRQPLDPGEEERRLEDAVAGSGGGGGGGGTAAAPPARAGVAVAEALEAGAATSDSGGLEGAETAGGGSGGGGSAAGPGGTTPEPGGGGGAGTDIDGAVEAGGLVADAVDEAAADAGGGGRGGAAPGGGIGRGGGGGGGGGGGPEPLMPPPPEGLSEEERTRLESVDARAGGAVAATVDLPGAGEQVGEARGAVEEPAEETSARAQDALVEALGERPEPSPEIEELCERIRTVIESKRPPDEESLVDADPQEMAEQAGTDLNESVEGDAERVQGEYAELEEPPEGAPAREPAPMDAPPGPADTPAVAGERATPEGVDPEDVSLDADVEASEQRLEEAGMETEPAQLVQSGPIAEARDAQGELAETAARDPQEVLAEQQATLATANADMAALTASALGALQRERTETTTSGRSQQEGMVGSEEQMRTQAAAEAERIFGDAQSRVAALLDPLPQTAMDKWEAGVQVLSTRFEQHLDRVQRWIDERHESTVLSVVDYLTGLPDWVTEEYDYAERAFGDGVCDLIREISTEVNGVIMACEAIIDDARTRIDEVFAALPAELQGWAAEQQATFGQRLDGLQQQAEQTRSDFTRDLTQRASEAVQSVRERVQELRDAARGLLGRIEDAVNAFLDDPAKFILEGLLQLVGIAPSAFWAVVDRIGQAIEDIADDPLGFANNLMSALGQGFQQFFDNVADHLLQGLLDWLFSGLGSVGVQIPSDTSLSSIITFFLQLMGLTWANIREILARHIGEENVALIEKAWELISSLIEMGPEGLFELIKEQLDPANLLNIVLEAAVDFLIEALISAVTPRIIALFNPAGAIVQAIEAIYRVLKWIFENAARIFSLVETVVNGVTDLIAGNIGGMANAVESALARLITPVIDFLAGYLGLGDLPEKIADVIRGLQQRVLAVVERVIAFLADRARALLRALGVGSDSEDEVDEDDPEKADRVRAGLAAIETEEQQRTENGKISREDAEQVVTAVRQEHPVFTRLEVIDGGDSWDYHWEASPGGEKDTAPTKAEQAEIIIVDVADVEPPGGSGIGALAPASAAVAGAIPGDWEAAGEFEREVEESVAEATGLEPPPRGSTSRWPARTRSETGLPAESTMLREPKSNVGGVARAGDPFRRPDTVVLTPEQVEVFEVTLDADFRIVEGATSHKRAQVAGTIFSISQRYPNAPIIYNIRAPRPPSAEARQHLEVELRQARASAPNQTIQIIWRVG